MFRMVRAYDFKIHLVKHRGDAVNVALHESETRVQEAVGESSSNNVFFFFQAEDGIRDYKVTGVQTCALPICRRVRRRRRGAEEGVEAEERRQAGPDAVGGGQVGLAAQLASFAAEGDAASERDRKSVV